MGPFRVCGWETGPVTQARSEPDGLANYGIRLKTLRMLYFMHSFANFS